MQSFAPRPTGENTVLESREGGGGGRRRREEER